MAEKEYTLSGTTYYWDKSNSYYTSANGYFYFGDHYKNRILVPPVIGGEYWLRDFNIISATFTFYIRDGYNKTGNFLTGLSEKSLTKITDVCTGELFAQFTENLKGETEKQSLTMWPELQDRTIDITNTILYAKQHYPENNWNFWVFNNIPDAGGKPLSNFRITLVGEAGPRTYVYNGSAWVQATPYVWDGTKWTKGLPKLYRDGTWK